MSTARHSGRAGRAGRAWGSVLASLALGGALHAQGSELYAINSGSGGTFLAKIDPATAVLTQVGPTGFASDGLAFSPDGELFAANNTNSQLVKLDPQTGAILQAVGPFGLGGLVEGLAFKPDDGSLWGVNVSSSTLLRIDTATGAATVVGPLTNAPSMAGLSWSLDGTTLYGITCNSALFTIQPTTGQPTLVGTSTAACPLGLATHPSDGTLYTVDWKSGNDMSLATVSVVDGSLTIVGTLVGGKQLEGISFVPNVGAYGKGCPGSGGFVPKLTVSPPNPTAGTQIAIMIDEGLGGANAHLFFGLQKAELPMGLGCSLNVTPLFPISLVLPLGGAGAGNGALTLPGVLPVSAAGLEFTMQAFVVDPNGALGFSNSNGFLVDVQ